MTAFQHLECRTQLSDRQQLEARSNFWTERGRALDGANAIYQHLSEDRRYAVGFGGLSPARGRGTPLASFS